MARLPRLVLPGHPHPVTQRDNRRQRTAFEEGGCALCRDLVSEVAPALKRYGDFAALLADASDGADAWRAVRRSEISGRPLGSADGVGDWRWQPAARWRHESAVQSRSWIGVFGSLVP